jgi:hypothetical protein
MLAEPAAAVYTANSSAPHLVEKTVSCHTHPPPPLIWGWGETYNFEIVKYWSGRKGTFKGWVKVNIWTNRYRTVEQAVPVPVAGTYV